MRPFTTLVALAIGLAQAGPPAISAPVYYPPESEVQKAVAEFSAVKKQKGFTGYHDTRELTPHWDVVKEIYGGAITPERLAKLREEYRLSGQIPDAEWVGYWMAKSDDEILAMLSPENPRSLVPNYRQGHPLKAGNITSLVPIWGKQDCFYAPSDGTVWGPGIKVKNPSTGEMVEIDDDGTGWRPPEGFPNREPFLFKAAYRQYTFRKLVYLPYVGEHAFDGLSYREHASPLYAIAVAWAVTGEQKYADRVLLILNRIAQFYRFGTSVSDVGGGIESYPFRTYLDDHNFACAIIANMALSYDLVWDAIPQADAVAATFSRIGEHRNEEPVTTGDIRFNIETNLFAYSWESLKRATVGAMGNMFFRQSMAKVQLASVFQNDGIIDHVLNGPKGIQDFIAGSFYRDGVYYEDSSSYARHGNYLLTDGIQMLEAYRGREHYRNGIELDPQVAHLIKQVEQWASRWSVRGVEVPYGDGGVGDRRMPLSGEESEGEQSSIIGHEAGLTLLRQGDSAENRAHLFFYHSNAGFGHGHFHQLMFKIISDGYDYSADIGYPANFQAPKRSEWTMATITHPTVLVDKESQQTGSTASAGFMATEGSIQAASAWSQDAYPSASCYHRTVIFLQTAGKRPFAVDLFRVRGGSTHDYPFHSLSGADGTRFTLAPALNLTPLEGTLAGKDVPYRARGKGGYSWLKDVSRFTTSGALKASWRTGSGHGYNLHIPAGFDGQFFTAKGENRGPIDESTLDAYLFLRREGSAPLSSTFVSLHEPVSGKELDLKVKRLENDPRFKPAQMPLSIEIISGDGERWEVRSALAGDPSDPALRGREWLEVIGPEGKLTVNALNADLMPDVRSGKVLEVDYTVPAVIVELEKAPKTGEIISFDHPSYAKATTFPISAVEPVKLVDAPTPLGAKRWKISLGQSSVLARGSVNRLWPSGFEVPLTAEKATSPVLNGKLIEFQSGEARRIKEFRVERNDRGWWQSVLVSAPLPIPEEDGPVTYLIHDFGIGDEFRIPSIQYEKIQRDSPSSASR